MIVPINPDWNMRVQFNFDANGTGVIRQIAIMPASRRVPNGGITSAILKDVHVGALRQYARLRALPKRNQLRHRPETCREGPRT